MRRLLALYAWLGPAIAVPLAWALWAARPDGGARLALVAVAVPIVYAYVVPGIGTNFLQMWEFDSRLRIGRFRLQHGFVFGGATAILTWLAFGSADGRADAWAEAMAAARVGAALLAANWIYDALAIRAGVLKVYNEPWARGAGPWAIAGDYAIWFFGLYGAIHGLALKAAAARFAAGAGWDEALGVATATLAAECALPALAYVVASRALRGHWGCRPFQRKAT